MPTDIQNSFIEACKRGDIRAIYRLQNNEQFTEYAFDDNAALHIAIKNDDLDLLNFLICTEEEVKNRVLAHECLDGKYPALRAAVTAKSKFALNLFDALVKYDKEQKAKIPYEIITQITAIQQKIKLDQRLEREKEKKDQQQSGRTWFHRHASIIFMRKTFVEAKDLQPSRLFYKCR